MRINKFISGTGVCSRREADAWVEAGNMVSNGPYIMTEWNHDQTMVLEQNPN